MQRIEAEMGHRAFRPLGQGNGLPYKGETKPAGRLGVDREKLKKKVVERNLLTLFIRSLRNQGGKLTEFYNFGQTSSDTIASP